MNYLKFYRFLIAAAMITLGYFMGCDSPTSTTVDGSGNGNTNNTNLTTLNGVVVISGTTTAIDSAYVRIIFGSGTATGYSGTTGKYSIQFTIDTSKIVTIITTRVGYRSDTTLAYIAKNSNNSLSTTSLRAVASSNTKSGPASSIYMYGQSTAALGVVSSGSPITGNISFQIVDSLGNPIDINHSTLVKFSFGARPNGGEFISPTFAFTDSNGRASVVLTSGTKAGVVQIIAQIDLTDRSIVSLPVSYVIFGGLPNQNHFGIASQYLNFPGYNIFGLTNNITAYLGDKYGNPVRPNTSVYFTTDGGIIEGSARTSTQGSGSVSLISAEPRPVHPIFGPGFATITASTADENSLTISNSMNILFSGVPVVTISPVNFDIPNGGSQEFIYEVKDQNGNPLAPGTNITVAVDGENVKTSGETNLTMPDTQSKFYTKFSFILYDSVDTLDVRKAITVKLNTTGPNGSGKIAISGVSR